MRPVPQIQKLLMSPPYLLELSDDILLFRRIEAAPHLSLRICLVEVCAGLLLQELIGYLVLNPPQRNFLLQSRSGVNERLEVRLVVARMLRMEHP
eukprot:1680740-Pyramimonas_sp.AAC.1